MASLPDSPAAALVLALNTNDAAFRQLDQQAELSYHAAPVRSIFNPPAATGMGFWSVNPYVGCAFGCAYCYARDTHHGALERVGSVGAQIAESMPPWLAFERRVLVKDNAPLGVTVRHPMVTHCYHHQEAARYAQH